MLNDHVTTYKRILEPGDRLLIVKIGRQKSARAPHSTLMLGDNRVLPFQSVYAVDFQPPLPKDAKVRSPLRNKELEASADLPALYRSAMQRVGE